MKLHPVETTVICTDSLLVHAVLKKDNWGELEGQRVCHNIMGAVALRGDSIEEADSLADKGTKLKQIDIPSHMISQKQEPRGKNGRSSKKEPRRSSKIS